MNKLRKQFEDETDNHWYEISANVYIKAYDEWLEVKLEKATIKLPKSTKLKPIDYGDEIKETCKWKEDSNEVYTIWETECGEATQFIEGNPEENNYKYCPYCGGKIEELEE